ncbi:MAG: hypothetical protein IPO78_12680 [Saprospiraceae bacterium]|nr:hypothetical protein [Saprospiraceae bacterium]MBK9722455.1 hypothetical protein [Saprospiraceae bacterium]
MDSLKRKNNLILWLFCFSFCCFSFSCNRGVGCPGEDAQVKVNKKGMPNSKPKSGLFDKKTTKKMSNK